MAQAFGIDHETLEEEYPRVFEQPFDSDRKRMTTVHRMKNRWTAYTKGAVDEMLPLCTHILTSEGVRPVTETDRANIMKLCLSMSEDALARIGICHAHADGLAGETHEEDIESDLIFIGVAGMIDPPRKEVADVCTHLPRGRHPYDYDHRRPQGNRSGHCERAGYLQRRQIP